jgi:beta-galactosidase
MSIHGKTDFSYTLERIFTRNSSVNFYMFIGGTSFGFMNGANQFAEFPFYAADVSSYGANSKN